MRRNLGGKGNYRLRRTMKRRSLHQQGDHLLVDHDDLMDGCDCFDG